MPSITAASPGMVRGRSPVNHHSNNSNSSAVFAYLFFGESVERRRRNFQHGEINIDLSAMMDFVFDHQAEPFPKCDACAVGSGRFFVQVGVGDGGENFRGFAVEAVNVGEDGVMAIGESAIVVGITAGLEARVFGPHVTLGSGEMAEEIAECEAAGLEGPFDFVWRDAASYAEGALADFCELVDELSGFWIFHFCLLVRIISYVRSVHRLKPVPHLLFWRVGAVYGLCVLIDQLCAAVGSDDGQDCEYD